MKDPLRSITRACVLLLLLASGPSAVFGQNEDINAALEKAFGPGWDYNREDHRRTLRKRNPTAFFNALPPFGTPRGDKLRREFLSTRPMGAGNTPLGLTYTRLWAEYNRYLESKKGETEDTDEELSEEDAQKLGEARGDLEAGDGKLALAGIRDVLQRNPGSAAAHHLNAVAHLQQGDDDGALEAVLVGLAASPDNESLHALAKLMVRRVDGSQAGASLKLDAETLLRGLHRAGDGPGPAPFSQPRGAGAAASRGPANALPGSSRRSARTKKLEREGVHLMQLGDFESARRVLSRAIEKDETSSEAHRLRSWARYQQGDIQGALTDARRSVELDPGNAWALKVRSLVHLRRGSLKEALDDINHAIELAPRDADAYATRAKIYAALGRGAERIADLKRAAELDPAFKALYRRALSEERQADKPAGPADRRHSWPPYAGAGLLCLLAMGYVFFRRKGETAGGEGTEGEEGVAGFDVVRKLGQGGMGEVFEARDRALERPVALKRLRVEISGDPRERDRFLKEARIVAGLKHPRIVEIYSVFERGEDLFLVFEFIDGEPLSALLDREGRLAPERAGRIVAQAAEALDYAHGRGVVHQDLKPANIMMAAGGIKVADFGIARRVQETLSTRGRGEVVGTPAYMAPEQERGVFSPESDVYSLGVCAYQLISGRLPFSGHAASLLKEQGEYASLGGIVPGVAERLDEAVRRALSPSPEDRFRTAGEFAASFCSTGTRSS